MISPGSTTTDGSRLVLTQGLKVDNLRQLLFEARAFFEVLTQVISIKSAPALARYARGSCAPPRSRCLHIGSATSMGRLRRSSTAPHGAVHTPAPTAYGLRGTSSRGHARLKGYSTVCCRKHPGRGPGTIGNQWREFFLTEGLTILRLLPRSSVM